MKICRGWSARPVWVLGAFCSGLMVVLVLDLSSLLVQSNATIADYIVVLDGHDSNYFAGLDLLRRGFGKGMLVCLDMPDVPLDEEEVRTNHEFIRQTAGGWASKIDVCSRDDEDTYAEVKSHLENADAHRVVIVTPAPESRAQLVATQHLLPEYAWSVYPTPTKSFGRHWWCNRLWAKTALADLYRLAEAYRAREVETGKLERSSK